MASPTVRAPGRPARSSTRDADAPTTDGSPDPRSAPPRALRFDRPARSSGAGPDRRLGILLSIALHVVLLVVLVVTDAVRLPDLASLLEEPAAGAGGERVVYMPIDQFPGPRTSATPAPPRASVAPLVVPRPEQRPAATRPAIEAPRVDVGVPDAEPDVAPGAGAAGSGDAPGAGEGSARDRFNRAIEALRPRALDPRLRPGNIDALRTDHERAALRAYARIRALNDSIMAEVAAGQRATDWTWTDDQGRRWGISPGKLHLGGIEIPLPVSTAPSREDRDLMREWQEIQAQAERGAIDETFDDRVEAIRSRRDAERREE